MMTVITLIMCFVILFGILIIISMLAMIIQTKKQQKQGDAQNEINDHDDDQTFFI